MNCPRCSSVLLNESIPDLSGNIEVLKCGSCRGIWLDGQKLARLGKVVEPTMLEIRHIPGRKEQFKTLTCPACGTSHVMQKAEHPRDARVIMDFCINCSGIWLDGGELEAIQKESWTSTLGKIFRWVRGEE